MKSILAVFDPYEYHRNVCGKFSLSVWSKPAGHLSVLCGENFNIRHYMQTVQPNISIPAILVGTVDFYQFIQLSLTLPGDHKISAKQNLLVSFCGHFSSDQDGL